MRRRGVESAEVFDMHNSEHHGGDMNSKSAKDYRGDIDGLRALAIIPVVLFHADIPGFSGGFIGVDIFFVISGYLITGILFEELVSGRIDIIKFYERRIRRIFPALFAVLLAVMAVGTLVLLPRELEKLSVALLATIGFGSNFLYWLDAGYFDTASELKPLLHTWSLAVEEQFYIFLPILLWMLRGRRVRTIILFLSSLAVASFVASLGLLTKWPSAAFFLLPSRAWELLAGSILAITVASRAIKFELFWANAIAVVGLALISFGVVFYNEEVPFPGAFAIPPVLGAALLIAVGPSPNYVSRILSHRYFCAIGLMSYSLYLWHWPLIAFFKICLGHDLSLEVRIFAVLLSLLLAYLSYRFVETPFRRGILSSRRSVMLFGAFCCSGAVAIAATITLAHGLPSRLGEEGAKIASTGVVEARALKDAYACQHLEGSAFSPCPIGVQGGDVSLIVYGDSHAMALRDVLSSILAEKGLAGQLLALPGCPPAFGLDRVNFSAACGSLSLKAEKYIVSSKPRAVLIVGSWRGALHDKNTVFRGSTSFDDESRERNVSSALGETAEILREYSILSSLALPVPGSKASVPEVLARRDLIGYSPDIAWTEHEYSVRFRALAVSGVRFDSVVDLSRPFCGAGRCEVQSFGGVYYVDDNHINRFGQTLVKDTLRQQIDDLMNRKTEARG